MLKCDKCEIPIPEGADYFENTEVAGSVYCIACAEALKYGGKFDGTKPRMGLIPASTLVALGQVLRHGALKYHSHNWRKGMAWSRVYDATLRHLVAWNDGEEMDEASGLRHLHLALCELAFLVEYTDNSVYKDYDDRFDYEKAMEKVKKASTFILRTQTESV